jgi:hypothetical protein
VRARRRAFGRDDNAVQFLIREDYESSFYISSVNKKQRDHPPVPRRQGIISRGARQTGGMTEGLCGYALR